MAADVVDWDCVGDAEGGRVTTAVRVKIWPFDVSTTNEMLDDEEVPKEDEGVVVVAVVEAATLEDPVDETLEEAFEDNESIAELAAELEGLEAGVADVVEEDVGEALVTEAAGGLVVGVAAGSEVAGGALHETWTVS